MSKINVLTAVGTVGCIKLKALDAFHKFLFRQTIHRLMSAHPAVNLINQIDTSQNKIVYTSYKF